MASTEIAYIGSAPAEEDCAQVGRTPQFERYNGLEVAIYRAAIVARWGSPPSGGKLESAICRHDFGNYAELQARYNPEDETACAYVEAIENGLAKWIDVGFLAPVHYDAASCVIETNYSCRNEAVCRVIVSLERQRIDSFGSPAEAIFLANLRQAYPQSAAEADQLLQQLATERTIRAPRDRRVGLYYPYKLTFYPALFNDHRGPDYPKGDVIDVTAHELRLGRCRYIACEIGTVLTVDDALALCWEHMARYVIA